jgi:hypothetical protein
MLKAAERYLADGMDDMEYGEWTRRKWSWYDRCDTWDSVSGRKNPHSWATEVDRLIATNDLDPSTRR